MNGTQVVLRLAAMAVLVAAAFAMQNLLSNGGGVSSSLLAQSPAEAEEAQVRVAAKRLANGRVELAVQVETQGQWSPRVLPEKRMLSARARLDDWLQTSQVGLSSGHKVRINARRVESGEVELGLVEIVNGESQDRQLPDIRLLPADQAVGEWWDSSPLTLPARLSEPTHVPLVREWTRVNPSLRYNTHFDRNGTITTSVRTEPTGGGEWATARYAGRLSLLCYNSENFSFDIHGLSPLVGDSVAVTLTIDGVQLPPQDWGVWTHYEDDEPVYSNVWSRDPRKLLRLLRGAEELEAQIEGRNQTSTWDLSDMLTTPVQGNLEHCGNYVVGYIQPPPPPNYVPLVNANGWLSNVRYQSRLADDGSAWAETLTYPEDGDLFLKIGASDHGEHFYVLVDQLPPLDVDEVSVVWSVDDGDSVKEQWGVQTFEGSHSFISPRDRPGFYDQLRGASSFTFEVKKADTGSVTLDLTHTFSTPVQLNIDERGSWVEGQSREPVYDYVPLANVNGTTDAGHYWSAHAPNEEGLIWTAVRLDAALPDGGTATLDLHCNGEGGVGFVVGGAPLIDADNGVEVSLRFDDGEAIIEQWYYHRWGSSDNEHASFGSRSPHRLAARLKQVSAFTFEVPGHDFGPITFNMVGFFDTPVQDNVDKCGMYKPGETRGFDYVPIVNATGTTGNGLHYQASVGESGGVYTSVYRTEETDGTFNIFAMTCQQHGVIHFQLSPLPAIDGDEIELTIRYGDGDPTIEQWRYHAIPTGGLAIMRSSAALLEQLRSVDTITVEAAAHDWGPFTFDITGLFDTPVQGNIDNCGMYKQGETRKLEQPESPVISGQTDSSDGESIIQWSLSPIGGTIPNIWTRHLLHDGDLKLFFWPACSPNGVTLLLGGSRFGEIATDQVEVVWSLDGGAEQRATWKKLANFPYVHPDDALALISAWRHGQTLDITVENATAHTQRFDLAELFGTPIQAAMDDCLALPQPALPAPAGAVDPTTVDQLSYGSGATRGSTVASTSLSLRVPSDDAPDWAGYSSRFEVHCGIGGYRIAIWGLGLTSPLYIAGDTVEVTWSADGGPTKTATWDVWPWNREYYAISPQDDSALYAAIKDADSLTITVASDPAFQETYDLAGNGFWETPVQPNLDACTG